MKNKPSASSARSTFKPKPGVKTPRTAKAPAVAKKAPTAKKAPASGGSVAKKPAPPSKVAGAPGAAAFFKTHAKSGELVDLYSSGWFAAALKNGALPVKAKDYAAAPVPAGRFLLLALDPYRKDTKAALKSTWKAMSGVIDAPAEWSVGSKHNPDFIAFNAHTGQILAFGMGRKAKHFLHAIDASGKVLADAVPIDEFIKKPGPFMATFTAGDAAGVTRFLLERFIDLSKGWEEFGPLPIFPEEAKKRLRRSDDDYSKSELKEILETGTRAEKAIDAAEKHFREIFKGCKVLSWELNPEDF